MDFGLYALVNMQTDAVMHPPLAGRWVHSLTLDQVKEYLRGDEAKTSTAYGAAGMSERPVWWCFHGLRFRHPENALREIAAHLRAGHTDPTFLRLLADHIDPDVGVTPFGTKLVLRRVKGPGPPPAKPDYELRAFLERHVLFFGETPKAVLAEAEARFGVGDTTCREALAVMERWRQSDPESFQMRKEDAMRLREEGDPDHQPLWPPK